MASRRVSFAVSFLELCLVLHQNLLYELESLDPMAASTLETLYRLTMSPTKIKTKPYHLGFNLHHWLPESMRAISFSRREKTRMRKTHFDPNYLGLFTVFLHPHTFLRRVHIPWTACRGIFCSHSNSHTWESGREYEAMR